MKPHKVLSSLPAFLLLLFVAGPLVAQDTGEPDKASLEKAYPSTRPYSPYADRHFPDRVYWGDTHLHTSFSMDAGAFGCRLGPRDAYRFAVANRETLAYIPCYCGCGDEGHTSNASCYIKDASVSGKLVFDRMSLH